MRSPDPHGEYHRSGDEQDQGHFEERVEISNRLETQESRMDQKARLSSLCAKWFYFCTHVGYFGASIALPNYMRDELLNKGNPWYIIFAVAFVTSQMLYIATWSNPGFLDQNPYYQEKGSPQKLKRKYSQKRTGLSEIREATNQTAKESSIIDYKEFKDVPEAVQEERVEQTLETVPEEHKSTVWDKISYFRPQRKQLKLPDLHYCQSCELTQPYRTKHCHQCGRCVRKFDHHCFWLGTCVGELNHGKFWIFLVFEFAVLVQVICNRCYSEYESDSFAYSYFSTFQVLAICSLIFIGVLLVQHTLLISVNMTTWEIMRRHSIDYMKIYPSGFKPFNRGFCRNWRNVLCVNECEDWQLCNPNTLNLKFNCCENKWWSCF